MNKKSHKKKKRRVRNYDGKNKENNEENGAEAVEDEEAHGDEQKLDLCYEVKRNDVMGRYLVANRTIKAGEVILKADALVVGPGAGCPIVCLGCYVQLTPHDIYKCPLCSWPLCGPACSGLGSKLDHSAAECRVLGRVKPPYSNLEQLKDLYYAITPLRCLLLKSEDPSKWSALCSMESHNDIRKKRGDIWPFNQRLVVDTIATKWNLPYTEMEIHTVCGILEVNAFEVGGIHNSARALYPHACLLSHACVSSTTHTECPRDVNRQLTVRAAMTHHQGELVTLSYAYTLQGTLRRRSHIHHSKFFSCECARCSDKTELGTYASALICPHCGTNDYHTNNNSTQQPTHSRQTNGQLPNPALQQENSNQKKNSESQRKPCTKLQNNQKNCVTKLEATDIKVLPDVSQKHCDVPPCVLPVNPLNGESEWKCSHCSYILKADAVDVLLKRLTDDLDSIDANDVKGFENFLHKYRNVLHFNHYLNLSAKHSLSQLYGKVSDYMIGDMTEQQLLRKIEICRELMRVFDVIEPGLSRLRGITLYELHAPLMILTTRDFEKKAISKATLRNRLKEVVRCLKEAAVILSMEPPDSSEGLMAAAAQDALSKIYTWEQIIGKIVV